MGFSTLIDILGSSIIGGLLLMILFRINDSAVQNNYIYGGDLSVQESLVEAVRTIEYDFRKIGYCADYLKVPFNTTIITVADSNKIEFITDFASSFDSGGNGILDTLCYDFSIDTAASSVAINPRSRILYRIANHEPARGANLGITEFRLTYFDQDGTELIPPIADTRKIITMQIDLRVESLYGVVNAFATSSADSILYPVAVWRQIRLAARNLSNR